MAMFRRKVPLPPDPLLESMGKGVLVQLGALRQELATLAHAFNLASSERVDALKLEKRMILLETTCKQIASIRDEDVARYAATLEQIRGQITGTQRKNLRGGVSEEVAQLGQKLVDAMSDPRKLQQVIDELSQLLPSSASPILNGHPKSPVG